MSFTHAIQYAWSGGGGSLSHTKSYTDECEVKVDEEINDGQSNIEIVCALDMSEVASLYVVSDQDLTFEGNDNIGSQFGINLKANIPYIWVTDSYAANLVGAVDVTSFFLTNASGSTANFKLRVLYDSLV